TVDGRRHERFTAVGVEHGDHAHGVDCIGEDGPAESSLSHQFCDYHTVLVCEQARSAGRVAELLVDEDLPCTTLEAVSPPAFAAVDRLDEHAGRAAYYPRQQLSRTGWFEVLCQTSKAAALERSMDARHPRVRTERLLEEELVLEDSARDGAVDVGHLARELVGNVMPVVVVVEVVEQPCPA